MSKIGAFYTGQLTVKQVYNGNKVLNVLSDQYLMFGRCHLLNRVCFVTNMVTGTEQIPEPLKLNHLC